MDDASVKEAGSLFRLNTERNSPIAYTDRDCSLSSRVGMSTRACRPTSCRPTHAADVTWMDCRAVAARVAFRPRYSRFQLRDDPLVILVAAMSGCPFARHR